MTENDRFLSTAELAKILGLSRVAVFNRIKNGQIKALRVGRSFAIDKNSLPEIFGQLLSDKNKKEIEAAVEKTVREYRQTLRLLGQE